MDRYPTLDGLLKNFDPSVHQAIRDLAARPGVYGIALMENVDFCSSRFGERKALAFGPGCMHTLEDILKPGAHLGDLPSGRLYPTGLFVRGS